MDLQSISLESIRAKKVGILGYGNQGRAHACNLRDSGVSVAIGTRPGGGGWDNALADGFEPVSVEEVARKCDVLMFLFPDHVIPGVYARLYDGMKDRTPHIGFAHGFAFHFKFIERIRECGYFLVGPKGAGTVLRDAFERKVGLPMVFGVEEGTKGQTREICLSYAKAVGANFLLETTFAEETECDLFGEQAVLCGGIMELIQQGFEVLVQAGHSPEMAFFETCFETRMILEVLLKAGPAGMRRRISPTAFYGGLTRGQRLVDSRTREEMEKIFLEIRDGRFAREWMKEAQNGMPTLKEAVNKSKSSSLEKVFQDLKSNAVF
jgi:ketol-acid reductoisomerase